LAKGFAAAIPFTPLKNILPFYYLPGGVVLSGLGMALAFGVASGFLPAIGGLRLRVADALRRV
jgi:ABC-type antimicrobial peptide transport system permease subunit